MFTDWHQAVVAGLGSDPYYQLGHIVYVKSSNGICELTVKGKWIVIPSLNMTLKAKAYNLALRMAAADPDRAEAPEAVELGRRIWNEKFYQAYDTFEHEDVVIPYWFIYASFDGCESYRPVFEEATGWPTIDRAHAHKAGQ